MRKKLTVGLGGVVLLTCAVLAGGPAASAMEPGVGAPSTRGSIESVASDFVTQVQVQASSTALSQSPRVTITVGVDTSRTLAEAVHVDFGNVAGGNVSVSLSKADRIGGVQYYSGSLQMSPSAPAGVWTVSRVSVYDGTEWRYDLGDRSQTRFTDRIDGQPGANIRQISMSPYADGMGRFSALGVRVEVSKPAVAVFSWIRDPHGEVHPVEYRDVGGAWQGEVRSDLTGTWEVASTEIRYADGSSLQLEPLAEFGKPALLHVD